MLEQTTRALCTASKRTYSLIGAATRHGPKRPAAAMRATALALLFPPRSAARLRRTSRELAELAEGAARPGEAVALVEMDGGRGARLVRAPEELGDAAVFAP